MADHVVHLTADHGDPFATGEECPVCRFDSILACFLRITAPGGSILALQFRWWCSRGCRRSDARA